MDTWETKLSPKNSELRWDCYLNLDWPLEWRDQDLGSYEMEPSWMVHHHLVREEWTDVQNEAESAPRR